MDKVFVTIKCRSLACHSLTELARLIQGGADISYLSSVEPATTPTDAEIVEMLAGAIRGEFAIDAAWKCLTTLRNAGLIGDGR